MSAVDCFMRELFEFKVPTTDILKMEYHEMHMWYGYLCDIEERKIKAHKQAELEAKGR